MSAQPDPAPPAPDLLAPGPASSDADLSAWRDAVTSGQLPTPTRSRWQVLRAGVVNLWEFDTAEYWFADGRAQFVGQNQSGKSTLMALTTLILLAGDLDRQYVDTFGERHKSFRYYVEPTDDANDRRDTDVSLTRGWAWVEYGRLAGDRPEFFSTLLYAQARRGAADYVKAWLTCHGTGRVGRDLLLTTGAHVRQPGELSALPGVTIADSGSDYRQRIATQLFGFDDTDRLDAVVKMLKVLRTPHLGRKLDPVFFTHQMREALPAIAKSEIDELAEGWDQLDKLAADRDSALSAQQAVQAFLRKAWNPWADSVLRRHADELVRCITRFDDVTKNIRRASELSEAATAARDGLEGDIERTGGELDRASQLFEDLRESQAYQDAHQATARVADLKVVATSRRADAHRAAEQADRAQQRADRSQAGLAKAQGELQAAQQAQAVASTSAAGRVHTAGLPADSAQWLADTDVGRLGRAVEDRRGQVRVARQLVTALERANAEQETALRRAQDARTGLQARRTTAAAADVRRDDSLQQLSHDLEAWAATLQDAPGPALRTAWLDAVRDQADATAPRATLTAQLRGSWLEPRTGELRSQVRAHELRATDHAAAADQLDTDIDRLLRQRDPEPAGPLRWARRDRPASGPDGAPLWLLLDPVQDLDGKLLAGIESALDAAGLLDSWVSADAVYVPDRDGRDVVVHLRSGTPAAGNEPSDATLASVLRPAEDAGRLTATLTGLLRTVAYVPAGTELPPVTDAAISGDGRWATAVARGTAGTAQHGAELIGTAARTVARDRRVAELRAEAAGLRAQVTGLQARIDVAQRRITELEEQAAAAPHDDVVLAAALDARHAHRELRDAEQLLGRREADLQHAATQASSASSSLHEHTGAHSLPLTFAGLDETTAALNRAAEALTTLRLALGRVVAAATLVSREVEAADDTAQEATRATATASESQRVADSAQDAADNAEEALGQEEKDVLAALEQLRAQREQLTRRSRELGSQLLERTHEVATATAKLTSAVSDRDLAEQQRAAALTAWWRPVDAGLAAHRGLPPVPEPGERLLTHAITQVRAAREQLTPPQWPAAAADTLDMKDQRVNAAYTKMTGPALIELRTVLESSGGRSASVLDAEETGLLPAVVVLVDSSGAQVDPVEAAARLTEQADHLARLHDEKMQSVLLELLSSTFVEHLRERLGAVVTLIGTVNRVLAAHPTGANNTKLRLKRVAADGQQDAFGVLDALENRFIGDPDVQEQVRAFLEQQIREAQDRGRGGDAEWKDHLAQLLDYRTWFDVVTELQVMDSPRWTALTAEVHAKDSGGGKVVTLLQPLLATLVALYDESDKAPRPLWLDEAFTGVDDSNRSTMLDLLVEFDLDFLLAGPSALVASAQVPSAAAWFVTRAPAPDVGVDLSLMLWAGRAMSLVPIPAGGLGSTAAPTVVVDADRPSLFDADPL